MPRYATQVNPKTGERRRIEIGKPFAPGFQLSNTPRPAQTYEDFINQAFSNPQYKEAQQSVTAAEQTLQNLQNAPVKSAADFAAEDPTLQNFQAQKGRATAELYATPFQEQAQVSNIFDPNVREKLIAEAISNKMGQISGFNDLINPRLSAANEAARGYADTIQAQIDAAKTGLTSAKEARNTIQGLLKDIAEKKYAEVKSVKDRKARIQDSIDEYMQKLEIDRALHINDFKPPSDDGGGEADVNSYVQMMFDWAQENPDEPFDLSVVPQKIRGSVYNLYTNTLRDAQQQATSVGGGEVYGPQTPTPEPITASGLGRSARQGVQNLPSFLKNLEKKRRDEFLNFVGGLLGK